MQRLAGCHQGQWWLVWRGSSGLKLPLVGPGRNGLLPGQLAPIQSPTAWEAVVGCLGRGPVNKDSAFWLDEVSYGVGLGALRKLRGDRRSPWINSC